MRRISSGVLHLCCAVSLALCARVAQAVPVAACGDIVPAREVGELTASLDCSAEPGMCFFGIYPDDHEVPCNDDSDCNPGGPDFCIRLGIRLERDAKLDLGGNDLAGAGVRCAEKGSCTVRNGSITGAPIGIYSRGKAKVVAEQLSILGGGHAIWSEGRVRAFQTDVQASTRFGIFGRRGIRAEASSVTGAGQVGFTASVGRFRGVDIVASNNGYSGVDGQSVSVKNLTAQGNARVGVISVRGLTLLDSNVTGNALASGGLDIESQSGARYIRLRNTVCDHSGGRGLCAID